MFYFVTIYGISVSITYLVNEFRLKYNAFTCLLLVKHLSKHTGTDEATSDSCRHYSFVLAGNSKQSQ